MTEKTRCSHIKPSISGALPLLKIVISLANAKVSTRQPWYIGCKSQNRTPPPHLGTLSNINVIYTPLKSTFSACATISSLTMRIYLDSFSRCCLPKMPTSAKIPRKFELSAVHGHPRSMIFVPFESAYATS